MAKYGRGLNKEIVSAVVNGELANRLSINLIRKFSISKGWDIPDSYINVTLANASSESHSQTYKKYFNSLGNGIYCVKKEFLK